MDEIFSPEARPGHTQGRSRDSGRAENETAHPTASAADKRNILSKPPVTFRRRRNDSIALKHLVANPDLKVRGSSWAHVGPY